jgi:hypothetical protein
MSDTDIIRVCVPVKDEDYPAPGSQVTPCANCDEPIWRSANQVLRVPDTQEQVTETYCLCPLCFAQYQAESKEPGEFVFPSLADLMKEFFPDGKGL